ncbi:glucocorticoid modulatory element-binding protein 1-like isoform X2 [Mastacembelus armatus]|nr:glucocorticoid modulatory element-binding protein 1-like isoform X2 [Mastacembelus armatus]
MLTCVLGPLYAALWEGVMAGAEVTVSSGGLMAVKEEEGEASGNNHKTQVMLHLQPVLQGVNDDIADTGTTVLAIETHNDDRKAGEEIEYGYPITCGESRAILLFKKFVCPGINVRCVKFNDQLISPKQFVHLAGKATLKDWKRAIRLGGVMLRKMMDSGQIDFYQHDTVCSNTCRSTKFDVLINSTRLPPGTSVQLSPSCLALDPVGGHVLPLTAGAVHDAAEVEEPLEKRVCATAEWNPRTTHPGKNGHPTKRKRDDTPGAVLSLWKGVADSGLMRTVLSSLQSELLATLKEVEVRSEKASLQETDAIILNSLCEMFGLLDPVKQALDLRRSQNEESKIHNSVNDEIVEEQKKQSCDKNTSYKSAASKLLRNERHSSSNSQTQNVPAPVKTVIRSLSLTGLSAASYAQLTTNPQLLTHLPASTGQHQHPRAGRMDKEGQSAMVERNPELSETQSRELAQEGVMKENTSGIYKEPGQRAVKPPADPHLKSDDVREGLHEIEKVIIGRKASKKHKSKSET